MKVWYGYGSEHSANLVMIGHFKEVRDAAKAKQVIEWLIEQVDSDVQAGLMNIGEGSGRFTNGMRELLKKVNTYSLRPEELEQFGYDVSVRVEENKVVVTTEEIDVSAFLKVLFDLDARVEVFSAHEYPDTGYGRGR